MGYIYKIVNLSEGMKGRIEQQFALHGWYDITEQTFNQTDVLQIHAFAHCVAMELDPLYTGSELGTITDRLLDLKDTEDYRQFDLLRQFLSDLVSFGRAKVIRYDPEARQTVPRKEGTPAYGVADIDSGLRTELQEAVERFLPILEKGNPTYADVRCIARYGILLDCIEPHYFCNLSGREDGGVSACERFHHAVTYMPIAKRAFARALLVLYTAAAYGTARIRLVCDIPEMPPDDEDPNFF